MWSLDNLNDDFAASYVGIREVWDSNLEEELYLIRSIIFDFPLVSMDTEFPDIAFLPNPTTCYDLLNDYNYKVIQLNVNILKLIQLGLTFFDSSGHLPHFGSPPRPYIWQFNFREFNAVRDICSSNSMERLHRNGIDIEKNLRIGVTAHRFSELFSYGILQNDFLQWITFRSSYDLGFLLKTLTCHDIPHSWDDFYCSLRLYFPKVYDIKHMMLFCNMYYSGPNKVAEDFGVKRVGTYHQAGSNSLLAAAVFKKLKDNFFHGSVERFTGVLYGGD